MINKSSMKHENEKDSIIKSELHFYMSMLKKSKKDLEKVANPCTDVSVGDIIVLYGDLPTYGLVRELTNSGADVIFLSSNLILSSVKALKLRINHLINLVAVSPIKLTVPYDVVSKYAERAGRVTNEQLNRILENFELLKDVENGKYEGERAYAIPSLPSVGFGELKEEYYRLERDRIVGLLNFNKQVAYDLIKVNFMDYFPKEYGSAPSLKMLVAKGEHTIRIENAIMKYDETKGILEMFIADEYIGKFGIVEMYDKILYAGILSKMIEVFNVPSLPVSMIKENVKVYLND